MHPYQIHIKVVRAKNIKGLKGDRVNSFVRVQFSDFDYKDVMFFFSLYILLSFSFIIFFFL